MKLYSRGQVIFFSLLSGLIVVLFALGIGVFRMPGTRDANSRSTAEAVDTADAADASPGEKPFRTITGSANDSFFDEVLASGNGTTGAV